MLILIIFLIGLLMALGTGLLAAYADFKSMTIPNIYSLIIAGGFMLAYCSLWLFDKEDTVFFTSLSHILAAVIVFMISATMFATKLMGAADSKLATAYALWVGIKGLFPFLFYMTLAGGLLGIAALLLQKYKPIKAPPSQSWIAKVQNGQSKVPYGIAITFGAFAAFIALGYLDLETFQSIAAS